ncbi:9617_t:CDS:2 [Dentiscutata heterogama]|uniref:9617_t:CDS:1 n=1 Tax=Dentiscutata heterogama TaxID=1316150 RepID=A0ACA9K5R2_9GLOM|nr:9617_t:CDS:2 [Dentiscutata heterogama]
MKSFHQAFYAHKDNHDVSNCFLKDGYTKNLTYTREHQPTNTGYSYGDDVFDTKTVAIGVYTFLQIFFQEFHKYAVLDFHVTGESYAGHFIAAIAFDINKYNHAKKKMFIHISLESILIGNGWVYPLVQYNYYPTMAYESFYGPIINQSSCHQMRKDCKKCINLKVLRPFEMNGINTLDVRKPYVKAELGANPLLVYQPHNITVQDIFLNNGDDTSSGTKGFNDVKITSWITTYGSYSGNVRAFKGFTFLKVALGTT